MNAQNNFLSANAAVKSDIYAILIGLRFAVAAISAINAGFTRDQRPRHRSLHSCTSTAVALLHIDINIPHRYSLFFLFFFQVTSKTELKFNMRSPECLVISSV